MSSDIGKEIPPPSMPRDQNENDDDMQSQTQKDNIGASDAAPEATDDRKSGKEKLRSTVKSEKSGKKFSLFKRRG